MQHLDQNIFKLSHILKEKAEQNKVLFEEDYIIPQKEYLLMVDAVLLNSNEILAVFKYFPYQKKISTKTVLNDVGHLFSSEYKYIVATNGIQLILVDTLRSRFENILAIDLISKILTIPSDQQIIKLKNEIALLIETKAKEFIDLHYKAIEKGRSEEIINLLQKKTLANNLVFDDKGHFFRLGGDIRDEENFENRLFNLLLDEVPIDESIYRYASLETVFATLNYKSIRMNGLAGMNDSSEVDYVNKYLDDSYSFLAKPEDVELINKRFISCFSKLEDSLNQWRLYGDDGKGACLTFKIVKPTNVLPGIKIKKISYGTQKNGRPFHLELELIKLLIESVRVKISESLRFRSLNIWKHFFKPFEYADEKEIRLLIVYNNNNSIKGGDVALRKDWNLTSNYKIIAPYITVDLDSNFLPIKLEKVTLGSKHPERFLNQAQLKLMLEEKQINNVEVDISNITNYR